MKGSITSKIRVESISVFPGRRSATIVTDDGERHELQVGDSVEVTLDFDTAKATPPSKGPHPRPLLWVLGPNA